MTEEALKQVLTELPEHPPQRRIVLDMPSWVPTERFPRWLLVAGLVIVALIALIGTAVPFAFGWLGQDDFETLGYPGIFLANFFGTATGFIPVPGLTAGGQGLIIAGAKGLDPAVTVFGVRFPPGVVIAGASAMTLAESTAYLTGSIGRGIAEERQRPKGKFGEFTHRAAAWIDGLMARYGFATLLVLSAVPNPLFEFAGITAGAVRMHFWRFLLAVGIGKTIRVLLLVIIGQKLLDWFEDIGPDMLNALGL